MFKVDDKETRVKFSGVFIVNFIVNFEHVSGVFIVNFQHISHLALVFLC